MVSPRFRLGVLALTALLVPACGKKEETKQEMLQRALSDAALPDEQAVVLIARSSFRDLDGAATLPAAGGKVPTIVSVRGSKEAGMLAALSGRGNDQGDFQDKNKAVEFIVLFTQLDRFLQNGRKRHLGDLTLTLQTPTSDGGEVTEWIEAYRLKLPEKKFDAYLKTAALDSKERLALAERIWKVEFDRFKNFRSEKKPH
jgi:hypothetical protein